MNSADIRKIKVAMAATWNYILADCPDEMGGEEVSELVLDADRLEMYSNCDKDVLKEFRQLSYMKQMELAAEVFPSNRYF